MKFSVHFSVRHSQASWLCYIQHFEVSQIIDLNLMLQRYLFFSVIHLGLVLILGLSLFMFHVMYSLHRAIKVPLKSPSRAGQVAQWAKCLFC